ncbi:MAG: hypothetical protein J5936_04890 [Acholeplasmatales bacterium]|nr:hypothetical protein [Acholeplasmatales bacterium]
MQSVFLNEDALGLGDVFTNAANKVAAARKQNSNTYLNGSISRYSKNLIMSFPAICDNSLPIGTVQMISKAHEKNLATMFEMLFSAMSLSGTNGVEILKKIHKDLGSKVSINDIIDNIEKIVGESTEFTATQKAQINDLIREMTYQLKTPQKTFPTESLNETSLNDYVVRNVRGTSHVSILPTSIREKVNVDPTIEAEKEKREQERNEREWNRDEREEAKEDRAKSKDTLELQQRMLAQARDIDYKKANELQPTVLLINYTTVIIDDNGNVVPTKEKKSFLAGIKSRMVGCDAYDIATRLINKNKSKLTFKDLIRATTGEIKFVSDFLLRTKEMKKLAIADHARKDSTTKMWKLLEKRADKHAAGRLYKSNDASPITTLILSQSTVDFIKASEKFDMGDAKTASKLMDDFNLLCIVICDEVNETAKFLYDGNNEYDMYSYSVLSKEASDITVIHCIAQNPLIV